MSKLCLVAARERLPRVVLARSLLWVSGIGTRPLVFIWKARVCLTCEVKMVYVCGLGTAFSEGFLLSLIVLAVVLALLRESLSLASVERLSLKSWECLQTVVWVGGTCCCETVGGKHLDHLVDACRGKCRIVDGVRGVATWKCLPSGVLAGSVWWIPSAVVCVGRFLFL